MPSLKRLRSVCHSTAQHAASGVSFIQPHLGQACREVGLTQVVIDLKESQPYSKELRVHHQLQLALLALQTRFEEILEAEGFTLQDLTRAELQASILGMPPGGIACFLTLQHKTGKIFEGGADSLDRRVSLLR
jgi:hypothetical protein